MKLLTATALLVTLGAPKVYALSKATCRVNPDPHFKTWHDIYYDYHGGCDLVLIQNPTFDGNDEFNLHIRTVPFNGWGGITNAALRIGNDDLEVMDDGTYFFNSVPGPAVPVPGVLGLMGTNGYVVTYATPSATQAVWEIALSNSQYVRVTNFDYGASTAGSISIEVFADQAEFDDSVGMCGTWITPGLIARDGLTDFQVTPATAGDMMGQEWQVAPSEPVLFQSPGISSAANCTQASPGGPTDDPDRQRQAEQACADLEGEEFKNCVFDIVVTGNRKWVNAPLYHKYKCASKENYCKKKGGKCVERKDCDEDTYYCHPKLCHATNIPDWLHELEKADQHSQGGAVLSAFRDPCVCAIPRPGISGKCCRYAGPVPYNCAGIEGLGPGADLDGRCNAVNQGNSCEWNYNDPSCCKIAMNDANCKLPNDEAAEACKCALDK